MTKQIKNSESLAIKDVLERVIELRCRIIEIFQSLPNVQRISDMPDSMIPTSMLMEILVTYEAMYEQLLTDTLIKSGNHRTDRKIH